MMTLEKKFGRTDARVTECAMDKKMPDQIQMGKRVLCPNIDKPFDDCYCISTSSLYTEATIYYCGGNYRDCEIYAKNAEKRSNEI